MTPQETIHHYSMITRIYLENLHVKWYWLFEEVSKDWTHVLDHAEPDEHYDDYLAIVYSKTADSWGLLRGHVDIVGEDVECAAEIEKVDANPNELLGVMSSPDLGRLHDYVED